MSGYVERSKFVEKKKLVGAILLSLPVIMAVGHRNKVQLYTKGRLLLDASL